MNISRSVVLHSFAWNLFEKVSVHLVSFAVTVVLARLLLPEEYGTVALISIFIALANVIIDGGLNSALVQKKDTDDVDYSTILYFSIAISILIYGVLFIIAPYIADFYGIQELTKIVRILAISLFFYAFNSVQRAYVYKHMLFKKLFYCGFVAIIISGVIGISMAYAGYGVWALVGQSLTNVIVSCLALWFFIGWRPIRVFSKERFTGLFSFGWKIFLTNFIVVLFKKSRALVIGKLFSPATLAYYDKGNHIPSLVMENISGSIQTVLFPAFSEVQDDRQKIKAMMRRSINVSSFFIFPLMVGLMVCAKPIILLLLTEKWIECVPFMQIICIAYFFRPITIPNAQAITAMGHSDITLKLEIIRKVVDVTILVVSCFIGVYAIAWGVVLFNFICIFINLVPNVKLLDYKIKEQLSDVFPILLVSLAMGASIYWVLLLDIHPALQLLIQSSIGVGVYLLLSWLFKIESFAYVKQMIGQRLNKKESKTINK